MSYTEAQLAERVEMMSGRKLIYSNQYGMLFILSENNEIFLNITPLSQINLEAAKLELERAKSALRYIQFQAESWSNTGDTNSLRGAMKDFDSIARKILT